MRDRVSELASPCPSLPLFSSSIFLSPLPTSTSTFTSTSTSSFSSLIHSVQSSLISFLLFISLSLSSSFFLLSHNIHYFFSLLSPFSSLSLSFLSPFPSPFLYSHNLSFLFTPFFLSPFYLLFHLLFASYSHIFFISSFICPRSSFPPLPPFPSTSFFFILSTFPIFPSFILSLILFSPPHPLSFSYLPFPYPFFNPPFVAFLLFHILV